MTPLRATWEPGLGDHLRTIWRYKWFLLGGAIVIAEAVFVLLSLSEARYDADASLRLTVRSDAGLSLDEGDAEYASRIYAELAESPRLMDEAALNSELDLTGRAASKLLSIDWARPPGFIDVTASGPDGEAAAALADGMAEAIVLAVAEDAAALNEGTPEEPKGLFLSAELVETALVPDEPAAPQPLRGAVAAFILSLVVLAEAVALWRPARGLLPLSRTAERVTDLVGVPCLTLTGDPEDHTRMTLFAARHLAHKPAALVVQSSGEVMPAASVRLAEAVTAGGRRVLVVDGDKETPAFHRRLGLPEGPGLAEVLAGERDLTDAVFALAPDEDLSVLTAGKQSGAGASMSEQNLLERLGAAGEYDFVIVNLAPTGVPDAIATAVAEIRQATILVIDPERTKRRHLGELVHGYGGQREVIAVLLLSADTAAKDTKRLAARWWGRRKGSTTEPITSRRSSAARRARTRGTTTGASRSTKTSSGASEGAATTSSDRRSEPSRSESSRSESSRSESSRSEGSRSGSESSRSEGSRSGSSPSTDSQSTDDSSESSRSKEARSDSSRSEGEDRKPAKIPDRP